MATVLTNKILDGLAKEIATTVKHSDNDVIYIEESFKDFYIIGSISIAYRYIDDSFGHEFGTHHHHHYEFESISDLTIERIGYEDEYGTNSPIKISDEELDYLEQKIGDYLC